jgi:hypothetical protein
MAGVREAPPGRFLAGTVTTESGLLLLQLVEEVLDVSSRQPVGSSDLKRSIRPIAMSRYPSRERWTPSVADHRADPQLVSRFPRPGSVGFTTVVPSKIS